VSVLTVAPAVAFSYFETLLRIGDSHKFLEEETRLKSMRNILNDAGFQEHLYEDFAEDTIDLLRETAAATDDGVALLQAFNDSNRAMSIITYLKAGPSRRYSYPI
jgi:ubiquitin thioesterase protein OTUB1